tara:strand:- start:964 stop:1167 length:204 start_codon:yes stop_codon:yes gene_type:complete
MPRPSKEETARVVAENREVMRRAGVTEAEPRTPDVVRRLNAAMRELRAEKGKARKSAAKALRKNGGD